MSILSRAGPEFSDESSHVTERLTGWTATNAGRAIWGKDPSFWPAAPASDVHDRLGWLALPTHMRSSVPELSAFADEIRDEGIRHVVVLGMGGSSLAPDVYGRTFGSSDGRPSLIVLDSTHPDAVLAVRRAIDPTKTLFLVSSKSGSTLEPLSFYRYFSDQVGGPVEQRGRHFAAITDPGTGLETLAKDRSFRRTFLATPDVGGRYSALTVFGLVPAALIGIDLNRLLDRAAAMAASCGPKVAAEKNPGLALGAVLGELAVRGRNKLVFVASDPLRWFPAWAEQLVAESTGKIGKGIVPVADEADALDPLGASDRMLVFLDGPGAPATAPAPAAAGRPEPFVRFPLADLYDIGAEFFRWEFAVAAAGAILGIDPFDQPDVEFAKELARQRMAAPAAPPASGPAPGAIVPVDSVGISLGPWLKSRSVGGYGAIQAYLAPTPETEGALTELRSILRRRLRLTTTLGFGPRFLHSTGQLHKGGPPGGLFLQLVDHPHADVPVPETSYSFGRIISAQAGGDADALRQRGRTVLTVDLGSDPVEGIGRLGRALRG